MSELREDLEQRIARVRELRSQGDRAGALAVAYGIEQFVEGHPSLAGPDVDEVKAAIVEMESEETPSEMGHLVQDEDVIPGFQRGGMRTAYLLLILLAAGVAASWPWLMEMREDRLLQDDMNAVLRGVDKLGLDVVVRMDAGRVLAVDLQDVPSDWTPDEVCAVLQRFARLARGRDFASVALGYRGTVKYVMDAAAFRALGEGSDDQTTLWGIPAVVRRPDGTPAFVKPTGRPLEVVERQQEDLQEMARVWYGGRL